MIVISKLGRPHMVKSIFKIRELEFDRQIARAAFWDCNVMIQNGSQSML